MYYGMIVCDPDRALRRLRDRIDRGQPHARRVTSAGTGGCLSMMVVSCRPRIETLLQSHSDQRTHLDRQTSSHSPDECSNAVEAATGDGAMLEG